MREEWPFIRLVVSVGWMLAIAFLYAVDILLGR